MNTAFKVGATVKLVNGTYTKQSDSTWTADGVPFEVEVWTDTHGDKWTPTLETIKGNELAFILLVGA